MSRVQVPIHVEEIDGVRVRYFSSPEYLERRSPDLAWHACDDLWRAVGIDDDERRGILRAARKDWPRLRTVATSEGPVVIQPHFMGEGMVDAVEESLLVGEGGMGKIRGGLRRGCTAASKAQVPHLTGMAYLVFHLEALGSGADSEEEQ